MANEQPESIHQELTNNLSPWYVVYDLDGGIGVSKGDFEPLNASDTAWIRREMRKAGINVGQLVVSAVLDSYYDNKRKVKVDVVDTRPDDLEGDAYSAGIAKGRPGADVFIYWGPLDLCEAKEDVIAGLDIFIVNESQLYKVLPGGMVDHTQGNPRYDGTLDDCDAPHFHAEGSDAHIFVPDDLKKRLRFHVVSPTN